MHSTNSTPINPDAPRRSEPSHPTRYRADIDGLRALAVLSVMLFHLNAQLLPGGFVGVDIFFVISGFVVSAAMAQAPSLPLRRFIAYFYARRLLRIVPALVLVLLLSVVIATLLIPRAWLSSLSQKTALYAFFGLSNWVLQNNTDSYFSPRAEFNPYTHTWSLGVEEQFYLIFPLLFFAWVRLRANGHARVAAASVFALLGVLSLGACYWATTHQPQAAFYGIAFRFWELAVGVLLFQLTAQHAEPVSPRSGFSSALDMALPWLGVLAIVGSFLYANTSQFPWFWALPPVLGTAWVIGSYSADTTHPVRRFLALPIAVWLGKRSYSLYLWHWPVFVLFRWTVGLEDALTRLCATALSVVLATLAYRFIELPIRHHPKINKLSSARRIVLMLAVVGLTSVCARVVLKYQDKLSISTVARHADAWYVTGRMPASLIDPAVSTRHCQVETTQRALAGGGVTSILPRFCRAPVTSNASTLHQAKGRLSVLGDSHAMAYAPLLEQLSAETGLTIQIYSYPGCSFLDLRFPMTQVLSPECLRFTEVVSAEVAQSAKPGDVLFLASLRQPRFSDQWAAFDAEAVLAQERSETYQQLSKQASEEAITRLQPVLDAGVGVLFDAPKPVFFAPPFRCVDFYNQSNPVCKGGLRHSKAALQALRARVLASMQALARQHPGITLWDSFPLLCPDTQCQAIRDGQPLFFDGDHLSAYGNATLYPHFRDQLSALMQRRTRAPQP